MGRGLFLSLDGIDGTGKSTQCELLAGWLRQQGLQVLCCSDPGSTPVGLLLRDLLLHQKNEMALPCEALLFMASRAELVAKIITPALSQNKIVICDRFLLANVVYQGYGSGLDREQLWQIGAFATAGTIPDLTLVLDLPLDLAQHRRGRPADRMEQRDREYHRRVREGFLNEARMQSQRIQVVDAGDSPEKVHQRIRARITPLLLNYQSIGQ